MKYISIILALVVCSFTGSDEMLDQKMPDISGTTLNNIKIDSSYFNGKVTLVNFMFIGCPPCMKEISFLNKLNSELKSNSFQILCVAAHTRDQLQLFNSDDSSMYTKLKKYFGTGKIEYELLPECSEKKKKETPKDGNIYIYPECETISKTYKIDGFPKSFLVDKKRVIKKSYDGFPADIEKFMAELKDDILKLQNN